MEPGLEADDVTVEQALRVKLRGGSGSKRTGQLSHPTMTPTGGGCQGPGGRAWASLWSGLVLFLFLAPGASAYCALAPPGIVLQGVPFVVEMSDPEAVDMAALSPDPLLIPCPHK